MSVIPASAGTASAVILPIANYSGEAARWVKGIGCGGKNDD